jgi:hypothetical protein
MRPAIVRICKAFHESVRVYSEKFKQDLGRHNYLTPTSYLELLATFQSLLLVSYRPSTSSSLNPVFDFKKRRLMMSSSDKEEHSALISLQNG